LVTDLLLNLLLEEIAGAQMRSPPLSQSEESTALFADPDKPARAAFTANTLPHRNWGLR
jgi:hypothetical protein